MGNLSFSMLGVVACTLSLATGCPEPEVGLPCDDDPAVVDKRVEQSPGRAIVVPDLRFINCISQGLCAWDDSSRPYCTVECESNADCAAEPTAVCEQIVFLGQQACRDWEDCIDDDGKAIEDCTPYDCVDVTSDDPSAVSSLPIKYCVVPNETLDARDEQYNRTE